MAGRARVVLVAWCLILLWVGTARAELHFGFAKRDVTPQAALRLSGYGNRDKPSLGTDTPLFVRAMALRAAEQPVHVILSIDSIGFPASFVQEILTLVEQKHGLSRGRLAVCATHSHTSPHLARGLDNLFSTPLTEQERTDATAYTDNLRDECIAAVGAAIANLQPGRFQLVQGTATFARHRRVVKDGVWTGFGENPNGPVDHRLPVLVITGPDGQAIRGVIFNYACHCTTFGGDYNRVNGDWAGYAAEFIEAAHPDCVALCTIGCGADANPERDSKRALEIAQIQGRQIADETERLLKSGSRIEITAAPRATFGFAGLPIDRPSADDLKKSLEDQRPQVKKHAEAMLATLARMGRLPESYPMPIQVWRFGDEFAMVFLGGEVCVEYEQRIIRELEPKLAPVSRSTEAESAPSRVFVTAYANDVFGYVAPERMRAEGGYEVDYSMIYYLQPGRWSTGTEEVILRRVHELFNGQGGDEPLSASDALKTFTLPDGLAIDLVVAEPLVRDPVNMAVDARGRLWVVEMGDYPRGAPDAAGWSPGRSPTGHPWDGPPGGRIRTLTDTDADGRYDAAVTFLEGLSFPTGVYPWRDGVIVSGAPDIFFARDNDGDGRADHREVLFTGFHEDNPQHRVNGFEYGLDGWLYLASGSSNDVITCVRTGEKVSISGRDLRIHPDTNQVEPLSGRSQYGRCRDDFGNWFGNNNSEPLWQYVIEDRQLRRNPFVASPSPRAHLTQPAGAPPVYPTSRTLDRFNDLDRANRFTSACGPLAFRDASLGADVAASVFVCEPVHNLVSRVQVRREGPLFTGSRFPGEEAAEFLSSTDPWFRPVRLLNGPDGGLWVCDMYRQVIEHPEWIPEAWQARLNLSAGADRGRIYRIRKSGDAAAGRIPDLTKLDDVQLAKLLDDPNGWTRDTSQRLLLERGHRGDATLMQALRELARSATASAGRTQALWTLVGLDSANSQDELLRESFLRSDDPELVIQGLRVFGVDHGPQLKWQPTELCQHTDRRVRYELALAAGDVESAELRAGILAALAVSDADDPWMKAAILSSADGVAPALLRETLEKSPQSAGRESLLEGLIGTALGEKPEDGAVAVLKSILPATEEPGADWQLAALGTCLDALARRKQSLATLAQRDDRALQAILARVAPLVAQARSVAVDGDAAIASRSAAVRLLGRDSSDSPADKELLAGLLSAVQPPEVQTAAIERLADLGASEPLLAALSRLSPAQQAAIETTILQHRKLTQSLLAAVEAGMLDARRLSAATRSALTNHREPSIRETATRLLGIAGPSPAANVAPRIAAVTPLTGDAAHGRVVFEKRCATCHRHQEVGVNVGPQLAALQNKSTDFLLTAILDANRSVEPKYRSLSIILVDGRQQTGLVAEETATSLTLVTADGRKHSVLRRDIDELAQTGLSFMPEGLDKDLTDQDLADLVEFLRMSDATSTAGGSR